MLRKVTDREAWCAPCGEMHMRSEFGSATASASGLNYACRAVVTQRNKAAYIKNGARRSIRHKELREARRASPQARDWVLKRMITEAARRAGHKHWPFDLTLESLRLVAPDRCPIFGMDLVYQARDSRVNASASLDRIDSRRGYTCDNVWIISWRANQVKMDSTFAELRTVADAIERRLLDGVEHNARPEVHHGR